MATDPDVRRAVVESLAGLTGRARTETVQRLAAFYAVSPQTISAWTRQAGQRVRAARADRGRSRLSPEDLTRVAAMVAATRRLDGDIILPVRDAVAVLQDTGLFTSPVSSSTVYRQLRAQGLSMQHLKQPTPFRYRASAHPNAEWQLDASNCVQYFLDAQGLGERDIAMELHRNHPAEFRQIRREMLRYIVVDHHSGMYLMQYRYAAGETAQDTLDVLTALGLQAEASLSETVATVHALKQGQVSADTITALQSEVKTLKAQLAARQGDDLVAAALKAGKITPAQHDWAKDYAQRDPEGFTVFVAKAPVVVIEGKVVAPLAERTGDGLDETQRTINASLGITDEQYRRHQPTL
jgi:transposase-like protein